MDMGLARAAEVAGLLASPILQEYDDYAVDVLAVNPASVQPVDFFTAIAIRFG